MATTAYDYYKFYESTPAVAVATVSEALPVGALWGFLNIPSSAIEDVDDAEWEQVLASPGFAKLIAQARTRIAAGQVTTMRLEDL